VSGGRRAGAEFGALPGPALTGSEGQAQGRRFESSLTTPRRSYSQIMIPGSVVS
jgi:hypothetical protein